jgi:hypothetical protein
MDFFHFAFPTLISRVSSRVRAGDVCPARREKMMSPLLVRTAERL